MSKTPRIYRIARRVVEHNEPLVELGKRVQTSLAEREAGLEPLFKPRARDVVRVGAKHLLGASLAAVQFATEVRRVHPELDYPYPIEILDAGSLAARGIAGVITLSDGTRRTALDFARTYVQIGEQWEQGTAPPPAPDSVSPETS